MPKARSALFAMAAVAAVSSPHSVPAEETAAALPEVLVTSSRLGEGVTGASTTVVTAADIARSPAETLPELLAREAGVQGTSFYGAVNGAGTAVDLRGFGAAATANTLVLLNGRRLNDVDLAAVDFAAIPKDAIERIEIVRGAGAAVLYGDGAMGGAINIVTRPTAEMASGGSLGGAVGSYGWREARGAAHASAGPVSAFLHGRAAFSDGYRRNNDLRQRDAMAEVRRAFDAFDLYANLAVDDQRLGLPGARLVAPGGVNELESDRRGTSMPDDFAAKQGVAATLGGRMFLDEDTELVVDAGVRRKEQQASLTSWFSYADTALTTLSLTPRVNVDHRLFGLPAHTTAGLDLYRSFYESDRMQSEGDRPHTRYDIDQRTLGVYGQGTVALRPDTDLALGLRLQHNDLSARDSVDPTAPGGAFAMPGTPLDESEWRYALHLGLEHRLTPSLAAFGRAGRSFRLPNVDERVGMGFPTTYELKTQTAQDVEAGLRLRLGALSGSTSLYLMHLEDEIQYSPDRFANVNLDPTRRWGWENAVSYRLTDDVRLRGTLSYTRATFRDGPNAGNDVPLVSRWTGGAGVSWNIWDAYVVLDADLRRVGERRLDNDQANRQPMIPAHTLLDASLSGVVGMVNWSVSGYNLLDEEYFDYGVASTAVQGRYNAYPMPGRTVVGRLGVSF